ncbi:MAG: serine/threonine protein kinase [Chitinophagaceae bacterium]|nr:serine/threonine protein kinase [Chitinophagaceae bacterium]
MIGEKIHSYEITEHLGKGGMGNVYKATDTMLGRDVALKMLHPQLTMEAQFLERFKKEARVLAQLLHPNIAVIYNFIEQGGNHFMVMEYVEGTNLDDLLKKHKTLPAEFVVPVFTQVLEGLKHAHKKNVFHRDIKPANMMLTHDDTVKLMDFGIAKVAGEQKMTQVNKIVGTVEFMAPELLQGKEASAASDIYAAGVTLYELLCGKLPFVADTDFNLMQAIMKEKVIHPAKCNASIPKALSDIIMKALDKNPAARFADAGAFQLALLAAFPNYRNINLASLNAASPAYAQQAGPATRLEKITGTGMETRAEIWAKPISAFENSRQHVFKNKKIYLTALLLLLCLFITIAIVKNKKPEKELADTEEKKPDNTGGVIAEIKVPEVVNPPSNDEVVDRRVTVPEPGKKDEEKTPDKTKEKKEEIKPPGKMGFKADEEEKEKEEPAQKKDVFISSKVEIQLYLQNDLSNAPERQDIPVTFSLKNNVVYRGVTIINEGAVAKGMIKLGKVQTDVDIFNITAANGQQITIRALKGHGRRNEISSNRNYTAIILPGTRINF